jgi:hypothetical protein
MAEFKLGRIKFVYQGTWAPSTSYVVDDVVTVGGKTYICVVTNTSSSSFSTDLNASPPTWNLVSDGQSWRGIWANSTAYNIGDLVQYGGIVYLCNTAHTSASTTATLTATAATANGTTATINFAALSSGIQPYTVGTSITVAGFTSQTAFNGTFTVTACTSTSVSYALNQTLTGTTMGTVSGTGVLGLELNQSSWTAFAANLNWSGAWTTNTRYKVDDFVYYGGVTYICTTAHVSANTTNDSYAATPGGLEVNASNWTVFNSGINYTGSWTTATRYKLNDIVKYGADLWICVTPHSSTGSSLDSSKFNIFVNGFQFQNSWSSATAYIAGDVVTYGGYTYTAVANSTNQVPSTATAFWQVFTSGITYAGAWTTGTAYKVGQVVTLGGYTYLAIADNTSQTPPNLTYWSQLSSGIRWNAAANTTYSAVAGTNVTGTGTSATFDVTLSGTTYSAVIHTGAAGTGYAVNNTIKILGTSLGGATPSNDLVLTVTAITGGGGTGPIATVSVSSGYAVTWKSGTVYVVGDAVYYGVSTYICISAHVGASGNNPIADSTGTYWNILANGADSGVLTTQGDMVYYGTNGPTRLPVGTDGQVLRVNGTTPAWSYYGLLNNVVYVAPNGTNTAGNGQGLTIDKPWASLSFACKQVEDGYLNTNAGLLLQINKQFMMKEVNNYILYTYTYATSASTTTAYTTTSTAGMYQGMPIAFANTNGGVIVGTTYYVAAFTSTTFRIATSYANATASSPTYSILTASSSSNSATFSYTQSKAERDTGTIVDGIIFDLTHGGNYYLTTATQSFFATATSFISTNATIEMPVWIASLNYLSTLFGYVLSNSAPTNNYQTLNGQSSKAIQNTTIVATSAVESSSLATTQSLLSILTGALTAGTYANIPQLQRPHTSIYLKTGTYNEYGPIVVPLDTAILGDELRSTIVQAASAQPYLNNDKPKTITSLTRVKSVLTNLIANSTVTPTTNSNGVFSNTQTQITTLPAGDTGSITPVNNIINNIATIQNMIAGGNVIVDGVISNSAYGTANGIIQEPAFTLPQLTGYNTTWLVGYGYGVTQLQNNYQFIKDEIINYLNNTLTGTTWASYGPTYQAETVRDLSNVLDALQYDLTYGCNDQSMIVGRSFYSLNSPLLFAPYTTGVLAALNRLSVILNPILKGVTLASLSLSPSAGNTTAQSTSGTGGSAAAVSFAQARIQDIINWINTGVQDTSSATFTGSISATTLTVSSVVGTIEIGQIVTGGTVAAGTYITAGSGTSWTVSVSQTATATGSTITISPVTSGAYALASIANQTAFNNIQNNITQIQNDAQAFVTKFYQNESPSLPLTNRDAGYITTALSYDVLFGSNFYSIINGRSFNRLIPLVAGLQQAFADATYYSVGFIGTKCKYFAASGAVAQLSITIDDMVGQIYGQPTAGAVFNASINGTILTINSVTSGTVAVGMTISGTGISPGTKIISGSGQTAGSTWLINYSQSVSSITTTAVSIVPVTNYITLGTTSGIVPGLQITFAGTAIGNLSAGTYYVSQVLSSTQLTISQTFNGSVFPVIANNTLGGVQIAGTNGQFTCSAVTNTLVVGQPVTISGSLTGTGTIASYSGATAVYYIVATNGSTTFTLSATSGGPAIVTTAGTTVGLSFASGSIGSMTATVYGIYGGLALTTIVTGSTNIIPVTAVTTSTNLITTSSTSGMAVNMPVVFSSLPSNITTTSVQTIGSTTNTITLAASASSLGIVAGQKVYFTGVMQGGIVFNQWYYVINPSGSTIQISNTLGGSAVGLTTSPTLSNVQITGTGGQFSCSSTTLVVGQAITISGTLSSGTITNYTSPTTYYIVATNGSTTFTLSATLGGVAITTTTSTGAITGAVFNVGPQMTVTVNAAGGLVNGNVYWINSIPSTTTLTVTSSYNSGTAFAITNSLTGLTAGATAGLPIQQGLWAKGVNGSARPWGNPTNAYQSYSGYNNTLTTINGGEILRANIPFLAAEAVAYTLSQFGGTVTTTATDGTITTSSAHNLTIGDPVTFSGTSFDGNITANINSPVVYWVLTTPTPTTFTISTTQPGTGTQRTLTLLGGTGSMSVNYYIITSKATRDMTLYLNALIYDLNYTGNYKSLRFIQLYLSSQGGSQNNNLFHVRNGTGIRNMTLNGLNGSLTLPNSYGTKRVTGGSYVSLDPGFGPNDSSVWANTRSCYVQNITNFGNGCVGMKIDAALHNGGNRSIVANDFTQVLSDGIGVYCTGHGALTECVSVFSYYGYAGYMAEFGGRIRATNGNSSYGTYGVIAEGIDSYETPITATLNNRANSAYITNVVTDAQNQIYRIEYENAGSAYTNAVPTISGSGYNAAAIQDEFRDSAVFETRLVDLNNGQGVGGSNYLTAANTAQTGSLGQITISNTDSQLSTAYVGMRIQLVAGTGVGQYANILSYSSGTKIAYIYRPTFVPLTITTNTTSVFTVASTNTLYASMPIYFATNIGGLSIGTVYYVVGASLSNNGTTFSVATSAANAAANTIQSLTATSATAAVLASSTIVGTTLNVGTVSSGTIYVGMLLSGTGITTGTYITANISGSGNGSTWTVSTSQNVASTTITGQISVPVYAAGWDHVIPGATTAGSGSSTVTNILDLTTSYIIEPAITYTSPGFTSTARSLQSSASWGGVGYGAGAFVAVGGASSTATNYSTNGTTWTAGGALPSSTTWNNVVYGGGQGATATAIVGGSGGSGAQLTPIIGTGAAAGQIIGVTVVNGGYNYTTPPTITFSANGTGLGATAVCEVLNGAITVVNMTTNGSSYTTNATVNVITSELSSITATTWGRNYFTAPTVTISAPFSATAWASSGSATVGNYYYYVDTTVTPNVRNYYLVTSGTTFSTTAPTFTNALYGKSAPSGTGLGASATYGVNLTYVGTLAVATANLTNNGVSSFNITQSGYGYTSAPTITITDPNAAFVAVSSASSAVAYSLPTTLSSAWTSINTGLSVTNINSFAYGNNLWIGVGGTSTTPSAISVSGNPVSGTWVNQSSVITGSVTYSAVAYGNGYFVAVPASGNTTTTTITGSTWVAGGALTSSTSWTGIAYGNGRFVALAANGTLNYSYNNNTNTPGAQWNAVLNNPLATSGVTTWSAISYGEGLFVAIATSSQAVATSWDGVNWTYYATGTPSSSNWSAISFGNPQSATLGAVPTWVAVSKTSGTTAASIATGATPLARMKVVNNAISEIRMIEPGSGFPRGNVSATTTSTNLITVDSTVNLQANQPILFNGTSAGGITTGVYYYVVSGSITTTQFQVSLIAGGSAISLTTAVISGMTYYASPITTQIDPNHVNTSPVTPRIGNGALGNPSFTNRGSANITATASISGDGYADLYQTGTFVNVSGLYSQPTAGSNVVFSSISNTWYKLVGVTNLLGTPGNYTATFQINPGLSTLLAPPNGTTITTNLLYSQVRLTGHDFLYIGTGGVTATNYPNVDPTKAVSANQELNTGGGRTFFTSTDQDGNFNVGNLFGVQQSTGTATLNASAFNLSGLQSLTLGSVSLGVGSATITQFSTDPYFTANSDSIVPTQKAIKSFITSSIGGGISSLNVNTITSGQIYIAGNSISNSTGNQIYVSSKMTFVGGIDGAPVALIFFSQR